MRNWVRKENSALGPAPRRLLIDEDRLAELVDCLASSASSHDEQASTMLRMTESSILRCALGNPDKSVMTSLMSSGNDWQSGSFSICCSSIHCVGNFRCFSNPLAALLLIFRKGLPICASSVGFEIPMALARRARAPRLFFNCSTV